MRFVPVLGVLGLLVTPPASAQHATELRLGEALRRADAAAFSNRGARGSAIAQDAAATATLRGMLPSVRVDAGYVRTTDPIGAFGTSLRQRTITQQAFDPARLNHPAAAPNYAGALVVEQPLVNADAWRARGAATLAARSADAQARWTSIGARMGVIQAWFGASLAAAKVTTLVAAHAASLRHVRQAESMTRNGLVTASDAMLASVKAGEIEASLLEARGELAISRLAVATEMGTPGDTSWLIPSALPSSPSVVALADAPPVTTLAERADVEAAHTALGVAAADRVRARALYLPRLQGFARYDWNSAARPFEGERNWTIGVMASWTPFAGASEIAEGRAAEGRHMAAGATADGARARAELEVARSITRLEVARARLLIAEHGARQAADAHRIVARKYEGGLATIVELLDASALETASRLGATAARYQLIMAIAERHRAAGGDPGIVARLDDSAPPVSTPNH